jgi:two-component system LytT family response regulator
MVILKCFIIEEELSVIKTLEEYIHHHPGLVLVGQNTNPILALDEVNSLLPDLVFIGINLSLINGLALSTLISHAVYKVFITAVKDFALEAFEKNAFDYLVKPLSEARFLQSINKLQHHCAQSSRINASGPRFIYVKSEYKGKLVKINFDEIYYIESANNHVIINLSTSQYNVYMPLKDVVAKLTADEFIRIHKSFVVNHSKINYIDGAQIVLKDKTILQLGNTYRTSFYTFIEKYTLGTTSLR